MIRERRADQVKLLIDTYGVTATVRTIPGGVSCDPAGSEDTAKAHLHWRELSALREVQTYEHLPRHGRITPNYLHIGAMWRRGIVSFRPNGETARRNLSL